MGKAVSDEKIVEMWAAFNEKQNAQHVASVTGVSWSTAKRYISKGNPKRNVEDFETRLSRVRERAAEEADYDLATSIAENLRIVRPIKRRLAIELGRQMETGRRRTRTVRDSDGKLLVQETTMQEVEAKAGDLKALVRLELNLLGEPDEVIEVRIKAVAALVFALMRSEGISDDKILRIAERVDELAPAQMETAARSAS